MSLRPYYSTCYEFKHCLTHDFNDCPWNLEYQGDNVVSGPTLGWATYYKWSYNRKLDRGRSIWDEDNVINFVRRAWYV